MKSIRNIDSESTEPSVMISLVHVNFEKGRNKQEVMKETIHQTPWELKGLSIDEHALKVKD